MDSTDENGNLSASYDQDAFGNVLSGSPSGYHLTTKDFSSSIGLFYFFYRWYDPKLGRFIQKDKIKHINRYIYCKNNPVLFIDPYGLIRCFIGSVGEIICFPDDDVTPPGPPLPGWNPPPPPNPGYPSCKDNTDDLEKKCSDELKDCLYKLESKVNSCLDNCLGNCAVLPPWLYFPCARACTLYCGTVATTGLVKCYAQYFGCLSGI